MDSHFSRGEVLFELKRYRDAIRAFCDSLAEDPDDAFTHAALGASWINLGKAREAESAVRRALELEPDMAYAHYLLSIVHELNRKLPKAEQAIEEAIRLDSECCDFFHRWAEIADQRGAVSRALEATAQALQLDPQHNPSIILRGKLLDRAGRLEEAHSLYVTALSHDPQDASAHHALGTLRLRTGDAGAALDILREARRLDPVNTNDAASIAVAYGRLIWPLRHVDAVVFRWHLLSHKKRWLLFTGLAVALVAGARLFGVGGVVAFDASPAWLLICVGIANYFALPYSVDLVASAAGHFALRREFGSRWYSLLLRPLVLYPAVMTHKVATIAGLAISIPTVAVIVCLGATLLPVMFEAYRAGRRSVVGWIGVPIFSVVVTFGSIGAVIVDLVSVTAGMMFLAPPFAVAYFSEGIIRWASSIRFCRRASLLGIPR